MWPMKTYFVGYVAALFALAILDALWLGLASREFYKARLGQLLLEQPNWYAAILFYLIHALGIVVFAVPLAGSLVSAALYGALFGFLRLRRLRPDEPGDPARLAPYREPRRPRLGCRRDGGRRRCRLRGDAQHLEDQRPSSYSG